MNIKIYIIVGGKSSKLGINSNVGTKPIAVTTMRRFLEESILRINDYDTVKELSMFVDTGKGIYKGQDNVHDDLVTSLYWACYSLTLDIWDDDVNIIENIESEEDDTWGIIIDDENQDWQW